MLIDIMGQDEFEKICDRWSQTKFKFADNLFNEYSKISSIQINDEYYLRTYPAELAENDLNLNIWEQFFILRCIYWQDTNHLLEILDDFYKFNCPDVNSFEKILDGLLKKGLIELYEDLNDEWSDLHAPITIIKG